MERRKDFEQSGYYQQQATLSCARAALATTNAEVKQAYLTLEEGWLCLAPKANKIPDGRFDAVPHRGVSARGRPASVEDAVTDAGRQGDALKNDKQTRS